MLVLEQKNGFDNFKKIDSMIPFRAKSCRFKPVLGVGCECPPFPFLLDKNGDVTVWNIAPHSHGRSFIVGRTEDGRSVVSKGNGFSYTGYTFANTGEMGNGTWGLLLEADAIRDFNLCNDVATLGVKTNRMEYVLELECDVILPNGKCIRPYLLQYDVECPYRISDFRFVPQEQLEAEILKWEEYNSEGYDSKHRHMIAANVLISNLRILHDNGILHNALTSQNYTWALELLDFELAHSPWHPYTKADYLRHVPDLYAREIFQTYNIIVEIAQILSEDFNYFEINGLFAKYGFDLNKFNVRIIYHTEKLK